MNTLNLIILLACISIVINVVLFIILLYNFSYIRTAINIFDRAIAPQEAVKLLDETIYKVILDLNIKILIIPGNHDSAQRLSFDKAFFDENKFKEGDIAFVGIITKIDNDDKNEIKDKSDKKNNIKL